MDFHSDQPGAIDLHTHSHYSDGSLPPVEVVRRAAHAGVGTLSLTDHDTVEGIEEASVAARREGLQFVPGVELSAYLDEREIHVLGYFIDPGHTCLRQHLVEFRAARRDRIEQMIERLGSQGIALCTDEILPPAGGYVGRPHLARALLDGGHATSVRDVYDRFLGPSCPAYVEKFRLTARDAFALIHDAGGIAVLAHPGRRFSSAVLLELAELGLDGVEVYHGQQGKAATRWLRRFARTHGMLITGGSDFHGEAVRPDIAIAQAVLPRPHFAELLDTHRARRAAGCRTPLR